MSLTSYLQMPYKILNDWNLQNLVFYYFSQQKVRECVQTKETLFSDHKASVFNVFWQWELPTPIRPWKIINWFHKIRNLYSISLLSRWKLPPGSQELNVELVQLVLYRNQPFRSFEVCSTSRDGQSYSAWLPVFSKNENLNLQISTVNSLPSAL